jgi:hypothetical protein
MNDNKTQGPLNDEEVTEDFPQLAARRKSERADVLHFQPEIRMDFQGLGPAPYRVQTVAEYGAGILLADHKTGPEKGGVYDSNLWIGDLSIPVKSRMLYVRRGVAGLEFIDPPDAIRRAIRSHFYVELAAAALSPLGAGAAPNTGPQRKLIFGKGTPNRVIIQLMQDTVQAWAIELALLEARAEWVAGGEVQGDWNESDEKTDVMIRSQFIGFVRNLRGLNRKIKNSIEEQLRKRPTRP